VCGTKDIGSKHVKVDKTMVEGSGSMEG
jgi:hypothetical protein